VSLENSKTDEDGQATHEECYVEKICGKGEPHFVEHRGKTGTDE
jgi:hypothetical protein